MVFAKNGSTGTVTNTASLYTYKNANSGGGTVTNNYGLYLSDQSGVGTNNYQIYSAGTNPFVVRSDGNVGIGSTTPAQALDVVGKIAHTGGVIKRVVTISDATSVTINSDTTDQAIQANTQSAGTLTMNAPTGTPVDGQRLMFRFREKADQTDS